jgi:hypothetical protein
MACSMASSECSSFGYELLTIAARNGAGWNAAACACQTTLRDAHSLGSHPDCAGFKRLVTLDVLLAGMSVMLEFATLIALWVESRSSFVHSACPLPLLGFSVIHSQWERVLGEEFAPLGSCCSFSRDSSCIGRNAHRTAIAGRVLSPRASSETSGTEARAVKVRT